MFWIAAGLLSASVPSAESARSQPELSHSAWPQALTRPAWDRARASWLAMDAANSRISELVMANMRRTGTLDSPAYITSPAADPASRPEIAPAITPAWPDPLAKPETNSTVSAPSRSTDRATTTSSAQGARCPAWNEVPRALASSAACCPWVATLRSR